MKIYWIKAQAPRRVLALVKHLGLDVQFVWMDAKAGGMRTPAYAAINPNRKAPTLVDGDFVLWESSAIMAHLCTQAGSDMWPVDRPDELVQVLRWLSWNDNHWADAVSPFYFEHVVKATFDLGTPDQAELDAALPRLRAIAPILDGWLDGRAFVACDRLTIADFQLAAMACEWRHADMPLGEYPNIVRWLDGLDRLPAWKDPWPAMQRPSRESVVA